MEQPRIAAWTRVVPDVIKNLCAVLSVVQTDRAALHGGRRRLHSCIIPHHQLNSVSWQHSHICARNKSRCAPDETRSRGSRVTLLYYGINMKYESQQIEPLNKNLDLLRRYCMRRLGKGDPDNQNYDDRNVLWLLFNFLWRSLTATITQSENRQLPFAR